MKAIMRPSLFFLLALACGNMAYAQAGPETARDDATQQSAQQDSDELTLAADRPGFANGTDIVPSGHIQLEDGAMGARSGQAHQYTFGQLMVRVPLAERTEVRVVAPSYFVLHGGGSRATGADDLFVEAKHLLAKGKKAAYGFRLNALLPTGARRVAEHKFQPGAALAADFTLSRNIDATLNLNYVHASNNGDRFEQLSVASSFDFTLSHKAGAFAEVYAFNQEHSPVQKYADGGFTYLCNPRTQLDAEAGIGLGNRAGGPDYFYSIGIARLF